MTQKGQLQSAPQTRSQSQVQRLNASCPPTFTCSRCSVSVSYLPGFPVPDLPTGWLRQGDRLLCVVCRRLAAAEALEALVDDELRSDPDRPNRTIAKIVGVKPAVVYERRVELGLPKAPRSQPMGRPAKPEPHQTPKLSIARQPKRRLDAAGRSIRQPKPKPPKGPTRNHLAENALRENPNRTAEQIAATIGGGATTVRNVRRELEAAGEIPSRDGAR